MLIGKTLANLAKALACALTCNSMLWTLSYEHMMDSTRSSRARSRAESRDPGAVLADPGAVLAARYKRVWADPGAVLAARYKSVWGGARSE